MHRLFSTIEEKVEIHLLMISFSIISLGHDVSLRAREVAEKKLPFPLPSLERNLKTSFLGNRFFRRLYSVLSSLHSAIQAVTGAFEVQVFS